MFHVLKILKENLNIMKSETVKTKVNVMKIEANLSVRQTGGDGGTWGPSAASCPGWAPGEEKPLLRKRVRPTRVRGVRGCAEAGVWGSRRWKH